MILHDKKTDHVIIAQTQVVGSDFKRHAGNDENAPLVAKHVRIVAALNEITGEERFYRASDAPRIVLDELTKTALTDATEFDVGNTELALETARKHGASTVYVRTDEKGDRTAKVPKPPDSFRLEDTPENIAKRSRKKL